MKEHKYVSSAEYISNPLDCRQLTLSVNFYQFDLNVLCAFYRDLVHWVDALKGNDFICRWTTSTKKDIGHKQVINYPFKEVLLEHNSLFMGFDAYVKSSAISNIASMRKYQRNIKMVLPYTIDWMVAGRYSIDYPLYFDRLFPLSRVENAEIIDKVALIFREENRKLLSLHAQSDFNGTIIVEKYQSCPSLYYGRVCISFGAFCLGQNICDTADIFESFAKLLAQKYMQVNIYVGLQPPSISGRTPYMKYFGKNLVHNGSHENVGYTIKEWYPNYYACAVEWLNILSPLTTQLLAHFDVEKRHESVSVETLCSGSTLIKSTKPITEFSWQDAIYVKQVLLHALYPGGNAVPLRGIFPRKGETRFYDWCPRQDWAVIPVEKQELQIIGTDLVFISRSSYLQQDSRGDGSLS